MMGSSGILILLLAAQPGALERALSYLSAEVPAWKPANGCYSCHNNGDAARALMQARRLGKQVPDDAVRDSLAWLAQPGKWDHQQTDAAFRDKKLSRIQFSLALAEAFEAGAIDNRAAIAEAAAELAGMQSADGSWPLDQEAATGSPATYGTSLATYAALRALATASRERFRAPIDRALAWLEKLTPKSTPDMAAIAMGLRLGRPERAAGTVRQMVARLLEAQTRDGGWGPYRGAPAEVFDTALALLVLTETGQNQEAVLQGAAWLKSTQLSNGGWPATTRPSGGVSYAQHISTSGWATLALLRVESGRESR
jgi:hypothetical protein